MHDLKIKVPSVKASIKSMRKVMRRYKREIRNHQTLAKLQQETLDLGNKCCVLALEHRKNYGG